MVAEKTKTIEVAAPDVCPICDCEQFDLVCPWKDKQIVKCSACGLVRTQPRPSEEDLVQLYAEGDLLREPNENEVLEKIEFPEWKAKEHRRILADLARLGIRGGRLLDVGCLWGSFLDGARRNGFEVVGVEPYERAARYARNVLHLDVHSGSLRGALLAPASFDAITILDVIEHLRDPIEELKALHGLLKPNGVLAVVTPNVNGLPTQALGWKRRVLGQPWCPIDDLPWHLWGFTPRTMAKALERAGFRVEGVHGLPPSIFTTNSGAGANGWKRLGLEFLGGMSVVTGHSDRLVAYARRTILAARNG
jgi:SAM-dependent methyltransferase